MHKNQGQTEPPAEFMIISFSLIVSLLAWWRTNVSPWIIFGVYIFLMSAVIWVGFKVRSNANDRRSASRAYLAKRKEEDRASVIAKVDGKIGEHIRTLAAKRKLYLRQGDYGEVVDDGWGKEIQTFLSSFLSQGDLDKFLWNGKKGEAIRLLSNYVEEFVSINADVSVDYCDAEIMDGRGYELFCAELLTNNGWSVTITPPTGDYGVDLVAEIPGRKIAIQCKRYNSPVGYMAVQEVFSGMAIYDANEAIVVSNSPYTSAARRAGTKLSVALLHHDDLPNLRHPISSQ